MRLTDQPGRGRRLRKYLRPYSLAGGVRQPRSQRTAGHRRRPRRRHRCPRRKAALHAPRCASSAPPGPTWRTSKSARRRPRGKIRAIIHRIMPLREPRKPTGSSKKIRLPEKSSSTRRRLMCSARQRHNDWLSAKRSLYVILSQSDDPFEFTARSELIAV